MNPYLWIIGVNVLSQGFLLILTGTFWDDFIYLDYNIETLYHQFLATGTPERILYIESVWDLPNYGYRKVVWCCYCMTSIVYYLILKKLNFSKKDSLLIAMLFVTVPTNTCRLTLCTVVYAFSVLFFSIAFLLIVIYKKENDSIFFRMLSLLLFFVSFFLNSNLFFYLIPLIYIISYRNNEFIRSKNKLFANAVRNVDFIILPIIFFCLKTHFFPTYGNYSSYNHFGVYELVTGFVYAIIGVTPQIFSIIKSYFFSKIVGLILFLLLIAYVKVQYVKESAIKLDFQKFKENRLLLYSSILMMLTATYPYLVVRQDFLLKVSGITDRDCILLPVGASLFIFSLLKLISKKDDIIKFCAVFILLGTIATNLNYLKFQRVEYWQRSLAEQMKVSKEIQDNDTFLFINESNFDDDYGITFYSINGISSFYAFGKQDKCWINFPNDLDILSRISVFSNGYCMNDYNINDTAFDGVVIYKCKYSLLQTIKTKILEVCFKQDYINEIKSHGEIIFLDINSVTTK